MIMEMVLKMRMVNGYVIELFQYIELFLRNKILFVNLFNVFQIICIVQIKIVNFYLYCEMGDEYIIKMWVVGLGVLYYYFFGVDLVLGFGIIIFVIFCKDMYRFVLQNSVIQG